MQEINKNFCCIIDNIILADQNYQDWVLNGGKELQLSAFKLTNRQMLWVAVAHVHASKFHASVPKSFSTLARLQEEYFHVMLSNYTQFRDSFECGPMTEAEEKKLLEFRMKDKILQGY